LVLIVSDHRGEIVNLEAEMKVRLFCCAVMLMFVVTGCAVVQKAGSGVDSGSSKGLSDEDLKKMGVEENTGSY
jgi:hypothetical protein